MSEQRIIDLLERVAEGVPDSAPPMADLLRHGRRGVRRRRAAATFTAAVAVAALAVAGALLRPEGDDGGRPAVGQLPTSPAGTRWVGVGTTVFAVPKGWSMWPDLYCQNPDGRPHVTIRNPDVAVGCIPIDPAIPDAPVVGIGERQGTVTVDDRRLGRTRTTLPEGWLAVPLAAPPSGVGGITVAEEVRALKDAGFHVITSEVIDWGDQPPVTTVPEIGAPARVGSTVTVFEARVPPAQAFLGGRLWWSGGPTNAEDPHTGTIHLSSGPRDWYVPTDAKGRWNFTGPPGRYTIHATSPGYLTAAGARDACTTAHRMVTARLQHDVRADVYCVRR